MMSFIPFIVYAPQLPYLKIGHYVKIGETFYIVKEVRYGRPAYTETGPITKKALNVSTNDIYKSIAGSIKENRLIHLRYLGLVNNVETYLYWGEAPLMSWWRDYPVTSREMPISNPYPIDRWTYEDAMRLAISVGSGVTQTLIFDVAEYFLEGTTTTPSKYLRIFSNGQASFVETASSSSLTHELSIKKI